MTDAEPLHPAYFPWAWEQVIEGGRIVCNHCGEPVPCVDAILAHIKTESHHALCQAREVCYYARRPLKELPKL